MLLSVIAVLPFLIFFVRIVIFRRSVVSSAFAALIVIIISSFFFWHMDVGRIAASATKGLFLAVEIILIIFGALLILEALRRKNLLVFLRNFFESVSLDKRVHILLIGWGLIYFLEGISGFGTPIVIAVLILLALGFSPMFAATIALVGDSIPVIFGAVGLPVTYGVAVPVGEIFANLGYEAGALSVLVSHVTVISAILNIVGSIFMPLSLIFMFTKIERLSFKYFTEFIPFALVAGLSASLPSLAVAYYLGPELATVIGGTVSIIVILFMSYWRVLLPKVEFLEKNRMALDMSEKRGMFLASAPYIFVFLLLLLSRLPFLPFKQLLIDSMSISIESAFGYNINYSFSVLYSAGFIMVLSAVFAILLYRLKFFEIWGSIRSVMSNIKAPFFSLALTLILVQVFMNSGENTAGLLSMPAILAEGASSVFGGVWPMFAPFLGSLGAFTAGSATVSNLIFSGIQYETAVLSGFSPALVLALQGTGAAVGNIIALHNVILALAVAGIAGKESVIIRKNLLLMISYLVLLGVIGFLAGFWLFV